jgi:starch phosphorylase
LTAAEVEAARRDYHPSTIIAKDADLARVMELLETDHFSPDEHGLFRPLTESIRDAGDPWLTAADFRAFVEAEKQAAQAYADEERWTTMSMMNTARSGYFSSDRTIRDYGREIWGLEAGYRADSREPIKGAV